MEHKLPLISIAKGGGARMQEGTPSMHRNIPKAQHALNEMHEAGLPHISIIADPTLGGTAISYGLRGDYRGASHPGRTDVYPRQRHLSCWGGRER